MYFVNRIANVVERLKDARPFTVFYYHSSAMENGIDRASFAGLSPPSRWSS
jgi:hypothetical protein